MCHMCLAHTSAQRSRSHCDTATCNLLLTHCCSHCKHSGTVRSLALSCAYSASCAAPGRRALVAHGVLQWLGSYVSADVTSSSSSTSYSSVTAGELQEGALGDVSSESASYVYACLLNNMAQVDALATITLTVYA
jgi:hypothetical protein